MMLPAALAAVAAGAYLNGRFRISNDIQFLSSWASAQRDFDKRFEAGVANPFYKIEEYARNPGIKDKTFLIFEGKRWTFKQFYEMVLHYAGWLHKTHNVVAGEIVAVDMMNSPSMLFLVIALWSLGAVPALINYNLISKSLIHSLRVSAARMLIIDPEVASNVLTPEVEKAFQDPGFRNNAFPLEYFVLDADFEKSLEHFPSYRASDAARKIDRPSDAAVLIQTSGTTGLPKAAIQSWTKPCVGGLICGKALGVRSVTNSAPDVFYTCMPLYHTTAFTLGFHICVQTATTFALGRKFSASNFWREVRDADATIIQYVGETLRYLLAAPPSPEDKQHHVRLAWGNGLRPDVWKKFKSRFGIETVAEIYGSSEGAAATWNINRNDFSDGAIGAYGGIMQLMASKTQAVVEVDWETETPWRDPNTGFCKRVPRGEPGEFLFALDPAHIESRYTGYLGNKEATDSKVMRNVFKKGDAYFRTGDTVRYDTSGLIWFSDRIGDTYRWKSENISTTEVGEVFGHHPAVHEANVYGVEVPGHEGRAGCAAIVLNSTAIEESSVGVAPKAESLQSIASYAGNSLPKYAVPPFLRILKEMPITGNNKYLKSDLRKQGIDIAKLKESGSTDKIYWLKPGTNEYSEFKQNHFQELTAGKVKL